MRCAAVRLLCTGKLSKRRLIKKGRVHGLVHPVPHCWKVVALCLCWRSMLSEISISVIRESAAEALMEKEAEAEVSHSQLVQWTGPGGSRAVLTALEVRKSLLKIVTESLQKLSEFYWWFFHTTNSSDFSALKYMRKLSNFAGDQIVMKNFQVGIEETKVVMELGNSIHSALHPSVELV